MVYIQFQEPILTHSFGFTTKTKYTFVAQKRIRPYAEFSGSHFWTDLARRIPEASSRFNFVLTAGFGVSYFQTDQAALNVGYRFQYISKADTRSLSSDSLPACPLADFPSYSESGARRMRGQTFFTTITHQRSRHETRPWNLLFLLDRTGCPHRFRTTHRCYFFDSLTE